MPALISRMLTGFLAGGLVASSLFASPTDTPVAASEAAANEADTSGAVVTADQPQEAVLPEEESPSEAVDTSSGPAGVIFRPPRRPSQLKRVQVDPAPAPTPDAPLADDVLPEEPEIVTSEESTGAVSEGDVPQELPAADVQTATEPLPATDLDIGTMSFSGVEPGTTTVAELKEAWGDPSRESSSDGETLFTYVMQPFKKVDVTARADKVTSVVVHVDPPMPPANVAGELKLRKIGSVPIPDAEGQLLGEVYPERGVLFGFSPGTEAPRVAQIVIEPISGEPFVMRALYDFEHRYTSDLKDLNYALSLDGENAEAHCVKSHVLTEVGRYEEALSEIDAAVRLDPGILEYRLQKAKILGSAGRYVEAIKLVEEIASGEGLPAHVQARLACQRGWLMINSPNPDYRDAIEFFQTAVKLASPLVSKRQFEIRRGAKRVLVDANVGIGCCVALGNYQRKIEVSTKWLDRAGAYAEQYVRGDNGPKDLVLFVLSRRISTQADMKQDTDPARFVDAAIQQGRQLIAWSKDPLFKQRVEWLLGSALMDAVRIEHTRGKHAEALRYAEMAVVVLESATPTRQLSPREQFGLGRFYFLAGAVHAVKKEDHEEAAEWYAKALPLLTNPVAKPTDPVLVGNLGEWLVSMGVTRWEVGDRDQAIELTERGADLIEQAIDQGIMKQTALAVPFTNLASMHRALGNDEKADDYAQLAETAETAAIVIERR